MILSHYPTALSIELSTNEPTVIAVETPKIMASYIQNLKSLIEKGEGEFCIYDGEKEIDFSKSVELILDPWSIDYNSKKVKTKLINYINEISADQFYEEVLKVKSIIFRLVENICDHIPYSLSYNTDLDMLNMLKMLDVRIDMEETTVLERIAEYIKLLSTLCSIKIFFLVNISTFLSANDIELLSKDAVYNGVTLVMIEAFQNRNANLTNLIIDKDQCIIKL